MVSRRNGISRTYLVPEQLRLLAALAQQSEDGASLTNIQESDDHLSYHVTDGKVAAILSIPKESILSPANGGPFPNLDAATPKGRPVCTIRVDPARLRKVLDLAEACDPEMKSGIFLEYHGDNRPLVFRVIGLEHKSMGHRLIGLCMPMSKT